MKKIFYPNDVGKIFYHRLNGQKLLLVELPKEKKADVDGITILGSSTGLMRCVQNCPQRGPYALAHGEFFAFEVEEEKPIPPEGQFDDK